MRRVWEDCQASFSVGRCFLNCRIRGFGSSDLVKRIATISTAASAVICCLLLICLAVSNQLFLTDFDSITRRAISHDSIAITSHFRCGISGGGIWFFNLECPYSGSTRFIADEQGIWYEGGHARETADWGWRAGGYGLSQVSFVGAQGEIVGKDRFGDFPGIYYRHFFEWRNQTGPCWTMRLSLWYPILLFAVLPALWVIRRRHVQSSKPFPINALR